MQTPRFSPLVFATLLSTQFAAQRLDAEVIASTGFDGRILTTVTTTNDTATGISWNAIGIADPGDLTAIPDLALANGFAEFELNGLFETDPLLDSFVANLNIHNEGSYYLDIPIAVTASAGLTLETLTFTGLITSNLGTLQGVGRDTDVRVEILDFGGEVLAADAVSGQDAFVQDGPAAPRLVTLDFADVALANGETATVRVFIGAAGEILPGNNAGIDDLSIGGTINDRSEPALSAPAIVDLGRVLAFPATTDFTVPIANSGSDETLTLDGVVLSGSLAASFEILSAPAGLAPGEQGEITLRFDPMGVSQTYSALLSIGSDDPLGDGSFEVIVRALLDAPGGDSDGDGLSDEAEVTGGETDPLDPDSDDDSLNDGDEVNLYGTNPLLADSDGDGFDDPTEISAGSDPLDGEDTPVFLEVIAATNFDGRTLVTVTTSNDSASGLNWTSNGVADPGDLTAVPDIALNNGFAAFQASGLFDTPPTSGAFVPDLNIHNEGSYYVDIPLDTSAPVRIEEVSLTAAIFNNAGNPQGAGREVDLTVALLDSAGDSLADDLVSGQDTFTQNGPTQPAEVTFDLGGVALDGGGSYRLRISVGADANLVGNNAGFDNLEISGSFGQGRAFTIIAVEYDPTVNQATIEWNSIAGTFYAVEASADLVNWQELDDSSLAAGDTTRFTESNVPAGGRRFYRVLPAP